MKDLQGATLPKKHFSKKEAVPMNVSCESYRSCDYYELGKTKDFLDHIAHFKRVLPINIRSALFGGRTVAFQLLAVPQKSQHIAYLDENPYIPQYRRRNCTP